MKQLCWGWWWPGGFQSQIPWQWLVFQIVVSGQNPEKTTWIRAGGRDCCFKVRSSNWFYFIFSSSIFQFFSIFQMHKEYQTAAQGGTFHFQWIAQGLENQTRLISPQRGSSHSFVSPVVHMKIEAPSVGSHSLNYSLVNQICPPTFKGVQHAQAIPVMAWACCTPSGVVVSRNSWQWE